MTESAQTTVTPPKPRRRVVRNTVFSALTKVQSAVLGYLTTLILLHALSVNGYGLYSVLFVGVVTNLGLLARIGIVNVLSRFIPEYYSQSNFRIIGRLFFVSNLVQAAVAFVLAVAAFLLAPQIAVWIGYPGSETVLRIFAIGTCAYLLTDNFRILLGGLFQQSIIMRVTLIYSLVRLAALFIATRFPDPLFNVVMAEGMLFVLLLGLYFWAYRVYIVPRLREDTSPETPVPWRRFTRYAGIYYLNEVGVTLINQATDLFLVSGFLGAMAAGLYALANRILQLATQVLPNKVFGDVIEPLFFSEYGGGKPEESQFGFNLFLKISTFTALPIGMWLALLGRPLITQLFDSRYGDAATILTVSGFILPMIALRMPLGVVLQNAERPDLLLFAKITGVIKIILGLWLLRHHGVMAMVWITFSTTFAEIGLNFWFVHFILHVRPDWMGMLRLGINNAIAGAILYPMLPLFQSRLGVIAAVPVFAVIYLAVNILHKPFAPEERTFLNKKLPYPLWKF
jgi:O-antigen/teichoic acid export membrane protein